MARGRQLFTVLALLDALRRETSWILNSRSMSSTWVRRRIRIWISGFHLWWYLSVGGGCALLTRYVNERERTVRIPGVLRRKNSWVGLWCAVLNSDVRACISLVSFVYDLALPSGRCVVKCNHSPSEIRLTSYYLRWSWLILDMAVTFFPFPPFYHSNFTGTTFTRWMRTDAENHFVLHGFFCPIIFFCCVSSFLLGIRNGEFFSGFFYCLRYKLTRIGVYGKE